ncbi:MAG: hypothetical protein WBE76_27195, partial [Terracidiphilus sp.]
MPGSTLTGSSATFAWTPVSDATEYWLRIGTTGQGSQNLYSNGTTGGTLTATGLPTTGATLYVSLFSLINGVWEPNYYTYTEAPQLATMTSPASGSILTGSSATFTWTPVGDATEYWLRIGTTGQGSQNLYSEGTTGGALTATGLPTTGATLYVSLFSEI